MKKIPFISTVLLVLSFLICSCSPSTTGGGGASNASAPTPGQETPSGKMTVTLGGAELKIGMEFSDAVLASLGTPDDVMKAQSCHYDGEDSIYVFGGCSLYTYQTDKKEVLYLIEINDESTTAPLGGKVGMSTAEIEAIYGDKYERTGTAMKYTIYGVLLIVHFSDSTVTSIELCENSLT